jgi:nucleoid-associated protein YejK
MGRSVGKQVAYTYRTIDRKEYWLEKIFPAKREALSRAKQYREQGSGPRFAVKAQARVLKVEGGWGVFVIRPVAAGSLRMPR